MAIISVSLDGSSLSELDTLCKDIGFAGRSEAVRAGIRSLASERKSLSGLSGRTKAVLLLVHDEKSESSATELKHSFEDVIGTQIHSHLKGEKCLEVFILEGEASRVHELYKKAQATKKIEYAKLVVP